MAIYFFDKNQTLIKIAPDSATFEAVQTQELDDDSLLKDTLSVTVKGDEKLLNAEYMAVKSYTGNAQTFDMYRIVTDSTPDKTMSFTGMSLAPYELNGHIIKDLRPANQSVEYTLNRILDGTDWRVGFIEDGLPNVTTTFYYVSAKEALKELQSLVGCEFVFKVEISGQKITDKWIEIYKEMGNRTKKRFNYGTNALTVVRETNKADIYTALIGRGKGEEVSSAEENESGQAGYGRKITFEDIEWSIAKGNPLDKPKGQYYLELPQATQVYGIKNINGTMSARVGVVEFDDEDDKNRLINLTYQQLLVSSRPKVLFKTTVANIGATGIGDTVTIHRHDLGIHYQTRVRKIVRNKLNDNKTQIELGDAVVTSSTKQANKNSATIKNLNQELERVKADVTTSQNSADGKNTIFYGSAEPERQRTGDTWFRPHPSINGETQMLVWNGTAWELVLDSSDLSSVSREVEAAISTAEDAKALAVSEAEQALTDANKYADEKAEAIKQEVDTSVNTAISTAEDAKQTAEASYTNAIADAQELVEAQSEAFNKKFEENATEMSNVSQAARDADAKAQSALSKAGTNANLLSTHQNTLNTINNITIPNINSTISSAASDAKAALSSASSAMDEARKADGKIADYVTRNGLVSGTTVDTKINEATGEINKKITTVESKIPTGAGINLITQSAQGYADGYLVGLGEIGRPLLVQENNKNTISGYIDIGNKGLAEKFTFSKELTGSGDEYFRIAWISEFGNVLRRDIDNTEMVTLESPLNAVQVRLSFPKGSKPKMERGSVATPWTPAPEDNYTQEEFKIFESTYNEDVKGINTSLTELSNSKVDGTTYTNFYNNEYKQTAQGVTDAYTKLNKIIDANGNSTDTFAKAVYDKNATRQTAAFNEVTKDLVTTATYSAGVKGINQNITTIRGDLDSLFVGGENLILNSNFENGTENWTLVRGLLEKTSGIFKIDGTSHNFVRLDASGNTVSDSRVETNVTLDSETEYVLSAYINRGVSFILEEYDTNEVRTQRVEKNFYGNYNREYVAFTTKENTDYVRVVFQSKPSEHGLVSLAKLERGSIPTPWSKSPQELLGKADFQVFKGTYESNDKNIKARLLAIDSGKEDSVVYNVNEALSTAQGNTSSITTLDTKVDNLKVGGENLLSTTADGYSRGYRVEDGGIGNPPAFSTNDSDTISAYIEIGNKGIEEEFVFSKKTVGNSAVNEYFRIVWISEFGNVLRRDAVSDNVFVTKSPSNAVRARFSFPTGSQAMMQKGNKPTEYVPSLQDQLGKTEFTLFKNDYEETAESVERRLIAIDGKAEGSVVTRLNKTESTASENKTTLTKVNNIITIQDTRNDNQLPKWYRDNYPRTTVQEFKLVTAIRDSNIPYTTGYGVLNTSVIWSHTSGGTVQQVFTQNDKRYTRRGWTDDTGWSAWVKMTDQEDIKNFVDSTSTEYQTLTERSNLYERVIGKDEAGVKSNISRIVQTSEIIQQTVTSAMNVENRNLLITKNATKDSWLTGGESYPKPSSQPNSGTSTSPDLIEVKSGDKFTLSKNETTLFFRVSFLNSSKGYIGRYVQSAKLGTITPPSGTAYMWVSYPTNTDAKVEKGSIATGYSPAPEDTATQSHITQLADNINLKVSKSELISEINVSNEGVRIAGKNIQLDGNIYMTQFFQVPSANIKDLTADKITGTTAQFNSLKSNILTANVITSDMIKAETGLVKKIFSTEAYIKELTSQSLFASQIQTIGLKAGQITSGTIDAGRLDAGAIVTAGLSANVIKSEHILGSTALIDKIFSDDAYIKRLTGKTAFISSIQAINISATRITSGTLDASKITVSNLDANSITGNKTSFVQSAWNDINSNLSVNGSELKYTHSDGSYTRINASGIQTVVGGSAYQHNYLMHIENVAINSGSDGNVQWVQLPSVFKGKQFRYFMGATDIYGAVTESAYFQNKMLLKRFVLIKHPDYNVDYTNARIPILGYAHYADIDSRVAYFRALQGIVVAQF